MPPNVLDKKGPAMRTLLTLACIAALGGCAIVVAPGADGDGDVHFRTAFSSDAGTVEGNGVAARDVRQVASLAGLDVGGAMVVDVKVGPAPSLVVQADANLLPLIRTEADGGTLKVYAERPIHSHTPVHITYTVPHLTDLRAGGSGRVAVAGLDGAPLTVRRSGSGAIQVAGRVASLDAKSSGSGMLDASALHSASATVSMSGSGQVTLGQVRGDFARFDISGSGGLSAAGAVQSLTVRVHGSGSAQLEGLASQDADLVATGSGGVTATVRQSVRGQTHGSGGIRVYGHPAQSSVSGNFSQI